MNTELMDATETLLAHLICANATGDDDLYWGGGRGSRFAEIDAGSKLKLESMTPHKSYTVQHMHELTGGEYNVKSEHERYYATDAVLLLNTVQDLIGKQAETALVCKDRIKWTGLKRLAKAPKGIWVASSGASLYEFHYREVFSNGVSTYHQRVGAISKSGKPVPCVITGSYGNTSIKEGQLIVLAASIIEDAHRPDVFTASIKDSAEIVLPVSIGEHKDLFALRDAPLTPSGRRKSILHWVSKHIRQNRKKDRPAIEVDAHLRGIRQFSIEGMTVKLSPNATF